VAGELFKAMTGVNMLHVPYRGGAPAMTDLIGGQVQVYFSTISESIEYIRAGSLRALAVATATRSQVLPVARPIAATEIVRKTRRNRGDAIDLSASTPSMYVMGARTDVTSREKYHCALVSSPALAGLPISGSHTSP